MVEIDAQLIEGFVNTVLSKNFDNRQSVPWFHREWWTLCCSNNRYVAIAAPRGHAKSTAITHSYVLASVLFRAKDYVIILSDTESQAILFLNDIKKELTENEDMIRLFGIKKLVKDSESDIIVSFSDGHTFRIQAKGSEQKLRGLKWKNKRPNLIVGDDLENDEIVLNEDRREKFRRWVYGALLPCLSDDGQVRIVGTILHLDSFLERLLPKDHSKYTRKEPLVSYQENTKNLWRSARYRAHTLDYTKILWPEKFNKEKLVAIRQEYVEQGMPDVYNQEYLNDPIDPSLAYFKLADFIAIDAPDIEDIKAKRKILNYYVGCDPAISTNERSDYTVFVVAGMDEFGILNVVDVIRERVDSRGIIDMIMKIQRIYKPELFAIEKEKITKAIGPFLREEMLRIGEFPIIEEILPSMDKPTRARSIQGRVRIGGVKFDKTADWYPSFESELLKFPKDRHDDQVDAFAYIGLALDKFVEAPTVKEMEDEEYEEMMMTSQYFDQGRCATTGY
jgi:predicted phage terminase large subunit-like protein